MDIYALLKGRLPVIYQASGRKETIVRCTLCGDSKDPSNAHLYIRSEPPHPWHCKRCDARGGSVGPELLRALGIYEIDVLVSARENEIRYAKESRKRSKRTKSALPGEPATKIPPGKGLPGKMEYLAGRLGLDPSQLDPAKYRIVTDLKEFFVYNGITRSSLRKSDLSDLRRNYLGFLSADGTWITFRDTTEKLTRRYFDLEVVPGPTSDRTYRIAQELDGLSPTIRTVLAEGIISLIGAEMHCERSAPAAYVACGGKGFGQAVRSLCRMGFLGQEIRIYSDGDVGPAFYVKMRDGCAFMGGMKITSYYNNAADDFGHPASEIKVRRVDI